MAAPKRPGVVLRSERSPGQYHSMRAHVDDEGTLHVEGEDVDPLLDSFVGKGEVEWSYKVRAEHLPALVEALGGEPGADVIDLLAERYTGEGSYELKRVLNSRVVPVERFLY